MEKVLVVWMEDQTRHIPLNQSLLQGKLLIFFIFMMAEKGEETIEWSEPGRHWITKFKRRNRLYNISAR
jgi:hypothetical protein